MTALATPPKLQFLDANGAPLVGGKLYTYVAGTTTPQASYTDYGGGTANANPVILDSRGEASVWLGTALYKMALYSATNVLIWTVDNIGGFATLAQLAASGGSNLVGFIQSGTGAVATTVQAKFRTDLPSVTDYGAVADGVTDNTATMLAAAVSSGKKFLIVPYGVKYNRATLLAEATFPDDVVLLDLSGINDFTASGETTKHYGIVSKDSAPDDTHWAIDSGHHPIINTNNFGTSGTASADERKASWIWSAGQFALGATDKRGFRGAAIQQFTQETGDTFWKWQIRSLAPWVSIDGEYEYWETGQVISGAGVYRLGTTSQQYVSAGGGTCGATPPTHTSGTVSDGGVSWTWIDSGDRTLFQCDQYGRWIIGAGTTGNATWFHKVNQTDPAGQYRFTGVSTGVSKYAQLTLTPTDGAAAEVLQPFLRAEAGIGLRVMNSTGSTDLARFSDTGGLIAKEVASVFTTNAATGATPSVDGIGTLLINNAGAQNITALNSGSDGQIVQLVFQNANTTMVSSATLLMAGSVNVTPTAWSVITMLKVPTSTSDRWIELSRSIK